MLKLCCHPVLLTILVAMRRGWSISCGEQPLSCEVVVSDAVIMQSSVNGGLFASDKRKETAFVSIENSMEFSLRYMLYIPIPGLRAPFFLSQGTTLAKRPVDFICTCDFFASLALISSHSFLQLQEIREALW